MAEFSILKEKISILQVCEMLGIALTKDFRAPCKKCNEGGPRAFRVFPETNTFWCYAHKKSGTIIDLVCAVNGCKEPEAGRLLGTHFKVEAPRQPAGKINLDDWGKDLNPNHEALETLGIDPAVLSTFGAGYNASKPSLKGLLCLPVRDIKGAKLGYLGISPETNAVAYPNGFTPPSLFNCDKVGPGTLHVVYHPLDVLRHLDAGIEELSNVVAVLVPITPDLLDELSALARERQVTAFEFHD